jgi:hypothetical protein
MMSIITYVNALWVDDRPHNFRRVTSDCAALATGAPPGPTFPEV